MISLEAQAELQKLVVAGELTPDNVVRAAASLESPLHGYFEWDNDKAAHRHRLDQARAIIRTVKIEVTTETLTVLPRYIRDPDRDAREQGYVETLSLRDKENAAREAFLAELRRALGCLTRAERLAVGLGLTDEIASLETSIRALVDQVRVVAGEEPMALPSEESASVEAAE